MEVRGARCALADLRAGPAEWSGSGGRWMVGGKAVGGRTTRAVGASWVPTAAPLPPGIIRRTWPRMVDTPGCTADCAMRRAMFREPLTSISFMLAEGGSERRTTRATLWCAASASLTRPGAGVSGFCTMTRWRSSVVDGCERHDCSASSVAVLCTSAASSWSGCSSSTVLAWAAATVSRSCVEGGGERGGAGVELGWSWVWGRRQQGPSGARQRLNQHQHTRRRAARTLAEYGTPRRVTKLMPEPCSARSTSASSSPFGRSASTTMSLQGGEGGRRGGGLVTGIHTAAL